MLSKDILDKYEYLTGEYLRHKPSVFEKAKSEYSPLGMHWIKQLKLRKLMILRNLLNTIVV